MKKLISYCGLDCMTCEAYKATKMNDDNLRKETAMKWQKLYNAEIKPEDINCTGCTEPGVKLGHCETCKVRLCAMEKGYTNCSNCDELSTCTYLKPIHEFAPEALKNLKEFRA